MVAELERRFPDASISMIPGGRGDFLVVADGVTIWDKRKTGDFPDHAEIVAKLS